MNSEMTNQKNKKQQIRNVLLIVFTIFLQSFSFLCIKYSTLQHDFLMFVFMGFALLFILMRAVIWQSVIQRLPLSVVYPFTSLVQILILVYAIFLFEEIVTINNVLGVMLMIVGVFLISYKRNQ